MTNNLQINTVYADLLSKVQSHFDNGLWKVSPNIQYVLGNYLPSLPVNKKCISLFILFIIKPYTWTNIFISILNVRLVQTANIHTRHGDKTGTRDQRSEDKRDQEIRIRNRSALDGVRSGQNLGWDEAEIKSRWSKFKDLTSLLASRRLC